MNDLLSKFRDALEAPWAPVNKNRLIADSDYEKAWAVIEPDIKGRIINATAHADYAANNANSDLKDLRARHAKAEKRAHDLANDLTKLEIGHTQLLTDYLKLVEEHKGTVLMLDTLKTALAP